MKVALYARVSTRDKQDPEIQLIRLREFCKNRGYEIYQEYEDRASGADWNRPNFKRLMKDAYACVFRAVIATKLDRIGRSLIDLENTFQQLKSWNINIICIDQPIDTTTHTGKLVYDILSAVAEFERELIRERVKEGVDRAIAKGKHIGRPKGIKISNDEIVGEYKTLQSLRKVAKKFGVSHVYVYNVLRNHPDSSLDGTRAEKQSVSNRDVKLTRRKVIK